MADANEKKPTRRRFLKKAAKIAVGAAALGTAGVWLGSVRRVSRAAGKKVIVIGIDGMDPRLSESMMRDGKLPNLKKLREAGGFSALGTSIPPQSPVAWANFINGAGPGSHGIFDFIHRHPHEQCRMFYSAAESLPGDGGWEVGDHNIQLDFWPFGHTPPHTVLRRQGTPFWDYLDEAGIPSTFYDLPSNYPPSPSKHGHHRCISGMGTPDMLGAYPTYQYFAEDGPEEPLEEQGGKRTKLRFEGDTASMRLVGPANSLLSTPAPVHAELLVHRDRDANAAVIEMHGRRIVLRRGEWSRWTQLDFELVPPWFLPNKTITGICRFYLRDVSPFRIYVSPININPADPALPISEPASFVTDVTGRFGPFYTTGFKEDYAARKNNLFNDDEFLRQANLVLDERLKLLEDAMQNYDDGVLFFYFSSSDLQSHIFWWESGEPHPVRTEAGEAEHAHQYVRKLYQRLDRVIGDLYDRYGAHATIIVMSDHGFANFGWQFNLNRWLRDHDYIQPGDCESIMQNVDWSQTTAYGLGLNGLYLNLKGRERDGIVEPSDKEELLTRLTNGLKDVELGDRPVIRNVYRASEVYSGNATALAPDLIVGYHRGFRVSWNSSQGDIRGEQALSPNNNAWSADHCADALEVPGVLWCNRSIRKGDPALVDIAPSILAEYGLATPGTMTGRNVFAG